LAIEPVCNHKVLFIITVANTMFQNNFMSSVPWT